MLNLSHIFGDLFCIAILVALIGGMIAQRESQETNSFLALIFTAMLYIATGIFWQLVESRLLNQTYFITCFYAIAIRVLAAELMHASLRYMYLVLTGRTPSGVTFWIPVLTLLVLCGISLRTGWIFRIGPDLSITPGPLMWVEFTLTHCSVAVSTVVAFLKFTKATTHILRLR